MTRTLYVGQTTGGTGDGLSWVNCFGNVTAAEDKPIQAGDTVYVAPGVYRERLTCDVSGANVYTTGTVSVTLNSKTVIGSTSLWLTNTSSGYIFHCPIATTGADGLTAGSDTFVSALGNFQADMVNHPIQINSKGAYLIGAVVAATTCTLTDVNTLGWPAATTAATLAYSVMSGEGAYDIESVDSDTQLTLTDGWQGPTIAGAAYRTYNPIRYIGDVTGEHTDGIGGIVRLTSSTDDRVGAISTVINGNIKNYRSFQGFSIDLSSTAALISLTGGESNWVIEDCVLTSVQAIAGNNTYPIQTGSAGMRHTIRRCFFWGSSIPSIYLANTSATSDTGHVISDCFFVGGNPVVSVNYCGGVTIKNCLAIGRPGGGFTVATALGIGQALVVNNSMVIGASGTSVTATTQGEVIENYNNFFGGTSTFRTKTTTGANSVSLMPLFDMPLLKKGFRFPWLFGSLSKWSTITRQTGINESQIDFFGINRPETSAKKSWGAIQYTGAIRSSTTADSGAAIKLPDAGQQLVMRVPTTNATATISLKVYREADYTSTYPQLLVRQPGQSDVLTTDVGTSNTWNTLTLTLPPAANPHFADVFAVSNNTTGAGSVATYWDTLTVS
jgi:hypothetical protein